jgi:hypothetical protein
MIVDRQFSAKPLEYSDNLAVSREFRRHVSPSSLPSFARLEPLPHSTWTAVIVDRQFQRKLLIIR